MRSRVADQSRQVTAGAGGSGRRVGVGDGCGVAVAVGRRVGVAVGRAGSATRTVPVIQGCTSQWYVQVPGSVKLFANEPPAPSRPDAQYPSDGAIVTTSPVVV